MRRGSQCCGGTQQVLSSERSGDLWDFCDECFVELLPWANKGSSRFVKQWSKAVPHHPNWIEGKIYHFVWCMLGHPCDACVDPATVGESSIHFMKGNPLSLKRSTVAVFWQDPGYMLWTFHAANETNHSARQGDTRYAFTVDVVNAQHTSQCHGWSLQWAPFQWRWRLHFFVQTLPGWSTRFEIFSAWQLCWTERWELQNALWDGSALITWSLTSPKIKTNTKGLHMRSCVFLSKNRGQRAVASLAVFWLKSTMEAGSPPVWWRPLCTRSIQRSGVWGIHVYAVCHKI